MPKGGWQGQEVRRKKWTPRQDHAAVPRTPVAKRFEAGGTDSSLLSISAPPRAHPWRSLRRAAFLRPPDRRDTDLEGDPRLPCTGAGAPSPLRFGAAGHGSGSYRPVRRLIGAATAPPLPCCAVTDRGFTARGRRARPRRRRAPAAGAGGSHSSRTFVTPRKMKRRKPIACLISACLRTTCRTRAGQMAQRGGGGAVAAPMRRRGRRPIEAPGSAAPNRSGDGAPASPHAVSGHAPRLGGGLAAALAATRLLRVGARAAQVVQVVRVLHQPVVHVVADLLARRADEV